MKLITLKEAREMSENRRIVEIGKRTKFLKEQGLSEDDARTFVASLLTLGAAEKELNKTK